VIALRRRCGNRPSDRVAAHKACARLQTRQHKGATVVGQRTIDGPQLVRRLGMPADETIAVASETASDLIVLAWRQSLGEGPRSRRVRDARTHQHPGAPFYPWPRGAADGRDRLSR
jgi:hypothetical protein